MKIVYFGFNALSSCLDLLIQQDHEIVALLTADDGPHNDQIIAIAESNDIDIIQQKPTADLMHKLLGQGVECFICAEYPFKIPIPENLKYAINIHPTLLPEGRGQTPLPHLILNYPQHAGVSLHKMTNIFDQGDILISKAIEIDALETLDSLAAKIFVEAPMLLAEVLQDIDQYYVQAQQQSDGSTWPTIAVEQQSIDWQDSVQIIDKTCRAFGSLGVKVTINEQDFYASSVQCVKQTHAYSFGDVIYIDDYKIILACSDGMVIIPRSCLHVLQ